MLIVLLLVVVLLLVLILVTIMIVIIGMEAIHDKLVRELQCKDSEGGMTRLGTLIEL